MTTIDPTPTADEVRRAGALLADVAARLTAQGWMKATSGNVSTVLTRDPFRLAVTASGVDKGELTEDDVVVVDEFGSVVDVVGLAPRRPSAEAGLHARIAACTGAGAVVHVHALDAVVAGDLWPGGVPISDVEMLKAIGRAAHDDVVVVPVVANTQDMDELGDRFVDTHDPAVPALLVAAHGLYVWGVDLVQARHHAEAIEWLLSYAVARAGHFGDHDRRPDHPTAMKEEPR
ncbi:MAG: methylthioribulose 1-phosphate dehydratase [Acidimicrobiia bacterium]